MVQGALGGRLGTAAVGVKEWSEVVVRTAVPSVSRRERFSEIWVKSLLAHTPHA